VLDLGSGSGLVGIAAGLAGAKEVTAADVDPHAIAATMLNSKANGVTIEVVEADLTRETGFDADLILAGDVFYDAGLAMRMLTYLDRCKAAGAQVLVGDPGRQTLPLNRLTLLKRYPVADFGSPGLNQRSAVYAL
jgi:predicted nicotinamide N-methyase